MSIRKKPTTEPEQRIYAFDKLYVLLKDIKSVEAFEEELKNRYSINLNEILVTSPKLGERLTVAIKEALLKVKHERVDDLRAYPVPPEIL